MTNITNEEKLKATEARRAYMREYRKKNRKRINEQQKQWRKANPELSKLYQSRYWLKKSEDKAE